MKLLYGHTEIYLHNTPTISWNFHPELSLEFLFENTVWAQKMHFKLKICNSNGAIKQRNVTYYLNQFQWKKKQKWLFETLIAN